MKPRLTAPKWEKSLYKVVVEQDWGSLPRLAEQFPVVATLAGTLDALMAFSAAADDRALHLMRWAWQNAGPIEEHPFVRQYLSGSSVSIDVAPGVRAVVPLSRDAIGLGLAELEQHVAHRPQAAITVVEHLEPSTIAAVSLCDLYLEAGRPSDVIDVTNQVDNVDDVTALLTAFRGVALRQAGHLVASREAFKEALKSKARSTEVRHYALVERSKTYTAEGKRSMARRDLERVLAENSSYPGIGDLLAAVDR